MELTQILMGWNQGQTGALDALVAKTYQDLRRIAQNHLSAHGGPLSLSATALVHEAYLKLSANERTLIRDRAHFFAFASNVLRSVLVDAIKARAAAKRGGRAVRVTLSAAGEARPFDLDVLALDEALHALADFDKRAVQMIEMRYFGGLSSEEIAAHLEMSPATFFRIYKTTKVWLYRYLKER
jgi:RNA polymerase sigma factor (TIGR02999 family)